MSFIHKVDGIEKPTEELTIEEAQQLVEESNRTLARIENKMSSEAKLYSIGIIPELREHINSLTTE